MAMMSGDEDSSATAVVARIGPYRMFFAIASAVIIATIHFEDGHVGAERCHSRDDDDANQHCDGVNSTACDDILNIAMAMEDDENRNDG